MSPSSNMEFMFKLTEAEMNLVSNVEEEEEEEDDDLNFGEPVYGPENEYFEFGKDKFWPDHFIIDHQQIHTLTKDVYPQLGEDFQRLFHTEPYIPLTPYNPLFPAGWAYDDAYWEFEYEEYAELKWDEWGCVIQE